MGKTLISEIPNEIEKNCKGIQIFFWVESRLTADKVIQNSFIIASCIYNTPSLKESGKYLWLTIFCRKTCQCYISGTRGQF